MRTYIPDNYSSVLNIHDTQAALHLIRSSFRTQLCQQLNLTPVIAPTIIEVGLGLQDNLSGNERPVEFDAPPTGGKIIQVLQDNCKWRRTYLSKHHFVSGAGIYASLDAGIRRDEAYLDNTHSLIINNDTWEISISENDRNLTYMKECVSKAVHALFLTQQYICTLFPTLQPYISDNVQFVSAQELENMYPHLSSDERETEFAKLHKTICVTNIGYPLESGKPHGIRSPDYDDWNLDFDILVYYPPLQKAIEIGGGGIRVTAEELLKQMHHMGWDNNLKSPYHRSILDGSLLPTIGGAFGGDRICMVLTGKVHIGEVRPSVWDNHTLEVCKRNNIDLM